MRYNIFNRVHRPLKEALLSTCISLSRNGDWNISSAAEAIRKVEDVLEICDGQVKCEAINILPYVFEYEPSVWNVYTTQHHKLMNQSRHLEDLVQSFYSFKGVETKLTVMELISDTFNEFTILNYEHMDDEEPVLNEILWRYYDDAFIMQMESEMELLPVLMEQAGKKGM